ncbi:serine/arginine repetitive matrix protein 2-like isoform X2 [Scylla paramamosain]|uniref:serine/arginine repetitive matrix protein 2-like isoform X2 n=1 Tax=Scylla paramamosain TaxID=85552 RepID=UPI003082BCA0
MSPEESRKEREARSLALERAYVHDVYDQISVHFSSGRHRVWPRVRQFLLDLEPGSFVADVGCGNGKYLHVNQKVMKLGVDRCLNLTNTARERDHEVMVSDNLALPFRDEAFDAALSIAVIHHFATTERRVRALRELARILRIGGRLMISVWAMEQRHRKFESQDVLVPWHRPEHSSSDDKTSSIERDLNSTTTDDDDVLHYHAHNHSDSDSCPSNRHGGRKNGRRRTRSRAIDPIGAASSSQSSSDLSSPNESCYSFVRRALQKLTSSRRGSSSSGKSWFLHGGSLSAFKSDMEVGGTCEPRPSLSGGGQRGSVSNDGSLDSQENLDDVPIELRHLEPDDPALLDIPLSPLPLLPTSAGGTTTGGDPEGKAKSKSLTDLVQTSPRSLSGLLGAHGSSLFPKEKSVSREGLASSTSSETSSSVLRSKSSSSCLSLSSRELTAEVERGGALKKVPSSGVSVGDVDEKKENVTDNDKGTAATKKRGQTEREERTDSEKGEILRSVGAGGGDGAESSRDVTEGGAGSPPPTGRKRPALKKQKASINESDASDVETPIVIEISQAPKASQAEATPEQDEDHLSIPKGACIVKQSSLNDEFICIDRLLEKEKLKQSIQKQSSLNEDLIYGNRPERRESLRESLFTTQFRRLQNIRDSFQRLRTASLDRFEREKSDSSLKKGIVKLLQSWKSEILVPKETKSREGTEDESGDAETRCSDASLTDDQKHTEAQRKGQGIYQLGRSCEGGEALRTCVMEKKLLSREPSERKPSREESSDSSKENSFQSDTSLDSEDSCVSVIFVPKPGQAGTADADKERHRSVSSESSEGSDKQHSPKSPRSPKSPKSPGPGGGRYFTPNRFLGTKGGVKTGPKMGTQVLAGASRPEPQRRVSPPSDSLPETTASPATAPGPTVTPTPEKVKTEAAPPVVREAPAIKTVASQAPRPVLGRGGSGLARVMSHCGSTPPATPPPNVTTGSYFSSHTPLPPRTVMSTEPSAPPPPQPSPPSVRQHESPTVPKVPPPITAAPPSQPLHSAHSSAPSTGGGKQHILKYEPQVVKRDTSFTQQLSSLLLGENIEIIRKTGSSGSRNVQIVRKTVPRYLTFDVFNPETDDLDSDSSASSSPNSGSSVIERGWPTEKDIEELDKEIKRREEEERRRAVPSPGAAAAAERNAPPPAEIPKLSLVEDVHRMDTISEDAREHSGSEVYRGLADRRRNAAQSAAFTRSSSVSRAFVDQTLGTSRREAESGKQRPVSMGSAPSSFLSTSSAGSSAGATGDGAPEASLKRSPKARRKLTIAHLDQPLSLQPAMEHKPESRRHSRSPEPLLDRQSLRSRVPERHHQQAKALSPMGTDPLSRSGDMKPWAEVAIKPLTETVNLPPPSSWRGRYSPEGIFKGLSEFEKKKSQEARKSGLELPFGAPCRGALSPSSSVSSTSPSVPKELGKEDAASRSPLLSSPTPSTSSGESRSGSHVAMSLFREGPFSLDLFKMSRSESSLPLLSPEDHRPNHGTFRDPVRPLVLPGPRKTSRLGSEDETESKEASPRGFKEQPSLAREETPPRSRRQHSSPLKVRIEDTKSQKESEDGKKTKCRLCARENEKRQKKRREEQLASVQLSREQILAGGARRRAATQGKADGPRRGELRSQGSLDSATEQKEAASSRSTPPLVRSGSLDLEKAERTQKMNSLSRDTSTSQDSLQSDMGGAPTLHRYYHVFREGELDQLIEKYVHNLHIISSYYDHANWCVVAEKVQVWTI